MTGPRGGSRTPYTKVKTIAIDAVGPLPPIVLHGARSVSFTPATSSLGSCVLGLRFDAGDEIVAAAAYIASAVWGINPDELDAGEDIRFEELVVDVKVAAPPGARMTIAYGEVVRRNY